MRVAVISCYKYRDAWAPFFALLKKFWPSCTYPVDLVTDGVTEEKANACQSSWCKILTSYLDAYPDVPILLMLEDFFLSAPVQPSLINKAVDQLYKLNAGCVRLYPCPGGTQDYGDAHFAMVPKGDAYRISTQAAIWQPSYLKAIAGNFKTPWEFELDGTPLSNLAIEPVLAFKRDVKPWPLEYLCTGITRGEWEPDVKKLCDSAGIKVDWSLRPMKAS